MQGLDAFYQLFMGHKMIYSSYISISNFCVFFVPWSLGLPFLFYQFSLCSLILVFVT